VDAICTDRPDRLRQLIEADSTPDIR
jgi:hypothetical protein